MGVNDALRLAAWLTAGGGGGIVGGVDLGWVLTSAGESGIVPAFCPVLPTNKTVLFFQSFTILYIPKVVRWTGNNEIDKMCSIQTHISL